MAIFVNYTTIRKHKTKTKVEEKVIDFLESKVVDKLQAFDRRSRFRKTVQDA